MLFGGIEAGGTKINLAVGRGPGDIRAELRLPTATPDMTIPAMLRFFEQAQADHGALAAIGIATFGPAVIARGDPNWGHLADTTKPGWSRLDFAGPFARAFGVPVAFDTDVDGAALAEFLWGATQSCDTSVYLTVGTGIGGGAIIGGRVQHGLVHPEIGHMPARRHPDDEPAGICPFHGDCFEGLVSGPAILRRYGAQLDELPPEHPAHALVIDYLGQLCATLVLALSPQRIVIGGGVMNAGGLHAPIAARMREWLVGFVRHPALERDDYVVPPTLGDRAGVLGALALAEACSAGA